MRLPLTVVWVLTEDDGPNRGQRREPERVEHPAVRRIDRRVGPRSFHGEVVDEVSECRRVDRLCERGAPVSRDLDQAIPPESGSAPA